MSDTEQATVVEEPGEEQEAESAAEAQETEESVKPKDELKVVIILNADKVMLGVQSPDCDPVYTTLKGNLTAALKRIPKLVDEANQKWNTSPRNPQANLPTTEPKSTPARTPAAPKEKPAQPKFF